jgi:hypothetical protein
VNVVTIASGLAGLWMGLAVATGCGGAPRISLTSEVPATPGDFEQVSADWTRHAELQQDFQQVISVDAVIRSPAYLAARAARDGQTVPDAPKVNDPANPAAPSTIQLGLVVATWDRRENNLQVATNPAWRVELFDDLGSRWQPISVERDRRSEHLLRADYPTLRDFSQVYIVTFPGTPALLGTAAKTITLRVFSVRGRVEVVWQAP